ncbi:MAG: chaperone NapD [Deltaproteobacteria bacterium]|nr:chaperone NapD [Deltaproteobacteria bacterium]
MSGIHLASCVGRCHPEALDGVVHAISGAGLAEVSRTDPGGRLVLLVERESSREVLAAIEALRAVPGLVSLQLAYQHSEDLPET